MNRTLAAIACLVLTAATGAPLFAQEQFSMDIDRETRRITAFAQGNKYEAYVHDGAIHIKTTPFGGDIRISAAEGQNKSMDWYHVQLTAARSKRNTPTIKSVEMLCKVDFSPQPAGPESRRAKDGAKTKVNMQVRVLLTVKKDHPCLFVEYRLINRMKEAIPGYVLPWLYGNTEGFDFPVGETVETRKYAGKYHDIGEGNVPWILVRRAEGHHLGVILPNHRKVYVGEYSSVAEGSGTVYLNHIERTPTLAPSETLLMQMVFFVADDAQQVADLAAALSKKP